VLPSLLRQSTEVGHHLDAVALGEVVDGVERSLHHQSVDDLVRGRDDEAEMARHLPRHELAVEHLAARVVQRRIGRQDAATRHLVGPLVEPDPLRRAERLPVLQHGADFVVPGQHVGVVHRVVQHRAHGSEAGVGRVRVDQDLVRPQVDVERRHPHAGEASQAFFTAS